jgi:hypothetical protein
MTNYTRRELRLLEQGYSTREIEEEREKTTSGSHIANALAFIVDSIGDSGMFLRDIEELDIDSMLEFADMYNFTPNALEKAISAFRTAAFREVTGTR